MELRTPPATAKGPATTFTGDVWLDRFADGGDESRLVPSIVRFTPGARTHWHSHPLGQTLHCTEGTPPGEEHWHGATRDNLMCHLALVVTTPEGASATWLEAVTDEKYASAQAEVSAGLAEEPTP